MQLLKILMSPNIKVKILLSGLAKLCTFCLLFALQKMDNIILILRRPQSMVALGCIKDGEAKGNEAGKAPC